MTKKRIPPIHPGEILLEEFMEPMGISQYKLAKDIKVQPTRISEIIHCKRGVSPDTAIRLGIYFGTGASFWTGLQMKYDLAVAEDELEDYLIREVRPHAA